MNRRLIFFIFSAFLLVFPCDAEAQSGFCFIEPKKEVEIPFELENNFIILTVIFNQSFPLKFIFDTGSEHTILTKREVPDALGVDYEREFRILGSDLKTELVAYLAKHVRLEIPEKIIAANESVLVLDDDYFRFEEFAGVNVHGILGGNVFSRYLIRINYQRRVMTLIERESFKIPAGFETIELENFRNKPYLTTAIRLQNDSILRVKLLLDTGAGHGLMLFSNTDASLEAPKNVIHGNIGMGLGGFLEGFLGRTKGLFLGKNELNAPITYFQYLDSTALANATLNARNGLIGNQILSRFQLIFDLNGELLYLKPIKKWQKTFEYDRSGLSIIAGGKHLDKFTVQAVLSNSPADEVGFLVGDHIRKIGFWPTSFYNLAALQKKFVGKKNQKINVNIRRNGQKISKKLILRDLI
jgi:Aspartyl protease